MVSIVAAISNNMAIGKDNTLLWKLPEDLRRFKELTLGHSVIMGRKTFESIGRALPDRRNVVVSRGEYSTIGVEVFESIEAAISSCDGDVFIIGGSEIYKQTISLADVMYLTHVDVCIEGDTFFPEFGSEWIEVENELRILDDRNSYNMRFAKYERCIF
jgi:dihydrofolate reductase